VTELTLDARSVLVMAHPDDEALWASSVLARVGRVLFAYEALPHRPDITEGRRAALARFPRPVESLRLAETAAFGAAAWPEPVETPEGLEVAAGPGTMKGFDPAAYRAGFAELRDRLRPALAGARTVITHAPWGEYGHEDHVQLCRAVEALREELGFALWVPAYVSARSAALMARNLGRLGAPTPPMPTDRALAAELEALYRATGCWTWLDDYQWPETEVFYPLLPAGAARPAAGGEQPMTVVRMPPPPPRRLAVRRRFAGWLGRKAVEFAAAGR
jgi:LmbE family N-acetylglucosaminyl deacetylase